MRNTNPSDDQTLAEGRKSTGDGESLPRADRIVAGECETTAATGGSGAHDPPTVHAPTSGQVSRRFDRS